jgi:hypothetical protein
LAQITHRGKGRAAQPSKKRAPTVQKVAVRNAKQQAKKIVEALHEAEQMHTGKRKRKSFDEFLDEL